MRPIDADVAIKEINGNIYWTDSEKAAIRNKIHRTPTIDPESLRPQGTWEAYPSDQYRRCSHCKTEWEKEKIPRIANYCPYCGARLRPLQSPAVTCFCDMRSISREGKPLGDEKEGEL